MQWLKSIAREVYGLFVDDGSFAAVLLVWIMVACVIFRSVRVGHWSGPALLLGLIAVLAENLLQASWGRR